MVNHYRVLLINDLSRLNWRSLFNKKPPAMRVGNIGYTEITFPVS